MSKRGDRAAPPARAGQWTLIFAEAPAAEGWEDLCRRGPGPTREAWEHLSRDPRDRRPNPERVSRLKHDLATRRVGGLELEQWQFEVTGAGRIWYCAEDGRRIVHITGASCGHPSRTE